MSRAMANNPLILLDPRLRGMTQDMAGMTLPYEFRLLPKPLIIIKCDLFLSVFDNHYYVNKKKPLFMLKKIIGSLQ